VSIISDADVAEFRRMSEASMPDSVTFAAQVTTLMPDGHGGGFYTGGAIRGPYPARVSSIGNPREQAVAERLETTGLEVLRVPAGTTVSAADAGTYTYQEAGATFGFEVVAPVPDPTYRAHMSVLIRRL